LISAKALKKGAAKNRTRKVILKVDVDANFTEFTEEPFSQITLCYSSQCPLKNSHF